MGSQGPRGPCGASASMRLPFPSTGKAPALSTSLYVKFYRASQGVVTRVRKTTAGGDQQLERDPSELRSPIFIEIAGVLTEKLSFAAL